MSNDPYALGSIDPYKLAAQNRTLKGSCTIENMPRIKKALTSDQAELDYEFVFSTDADNVCVISGYMQGLLKLCCQRCLQSFAHKIICEFAVSPVLNERAAKGLSGAYEPVMLIDGKVDLLELLEDELILALPQVPMHDVNTEDRSGQLCDVTNKYYEEQDFVSPFQVLQKLKLKHSGPEVDGGKGGKNGSTTK